VLVKYQTLKTKTLFPIMQQYVSPFRNLGIDVTQEVDKNALNNAKNTLLAELDMSEKGTILRGGVEKAKNDVIQLFDGLDDAQSLEFHRQIASNRGLLAFLEKQKLDTKNEFVDDLAFMPSNFKTFISPYLTHSCVEYLINCLKNAQSANIQIFPMSLIKQLSANELENVWQGIEKYLKEQRAQADNLTERIKHRDKVKIGDTMPFRSPQFVACLNWLPQRFHELRTGYVASLFYLAEACWDIKAHKVAVDILQYAAHINGAEQNKLVVQARLQGYENSLAQVLKSAEQERAFKYVLGAIAAILLVFFVFRIRPSSPKPKETARVDKIFRFTEDMVVADTIPFNDSIPRIATDFQKVFHNPKLTYKEKSSKSKFLIVRIDAIEKDSTNRIQASTTKQFIQSFTKDFDRKAKEEEPSVKVKNEKRKVKNS
jgi:hypothetical protein